MPTYQYACTACGHDFDVVQSFSDAALTDCPQCSGRLRKVFSPVGVVFKGSGFYRTDSRGAGGGGKAKTDSPVAASGPEKSETAGPTSAPSSDAGSAASTGGSTGGSKTSTPASSGGGSAA